ncbi:hypothetical protein GOP47_0021524 [Adiantum capillus-veneris]|uniref:Cation/H+ exchanger transmembrane domain-containing protein n=1 Tax=Adiantum capillus-veneris TaxID=13818 RepID=A0A9D4Z720_ADICA|nr:hypothetical protein GOP47_0021524 [Adiantum capillus-veneris]
MGKFWQANRAPSSHNYAYFRQGIFFILLLGTLHAADLCFATRVDINEDADDAFDEGFDESSSANTTTPAPPPKEGSIADMIDRVLEKEFSEKDHQEGNDAKGSNFNSSVTDQQAVLETVARVSHEKPKKNDTKAENGTSKSFQIQDVFRVESDGGAEELPTLIDKKDNIFVMSNPKSKYPVLQLDLRFISDMVVVIVSAAVGGILFACMGQPVITGYLLAGSAIGPGGLSFVSELVQVETVAQFGVVFLLFALGLEFSTTKLRVVRSVAIFGGLLQIILFMCLCGITALLCGAKTTEGVFVGAFLSISSTAVVLKFLMERNSVNALHGQVTIGTLILQDCCVGLLFALLPVLGGSTGVFHGLVSMLRTLLLLALFLALSMIISRSFVPRFLKLMMRLSSQQTNELYQLAAVAFCLVVAWCSDKLGLSLELGSFVAGVMISTTDFAEHTLQQVEPIRNLFAALFLSSIGMLINVQFLLSHMDILLASVILVIIAKTFVVTVVVRLFGYSMKNSFLVGMSLAQIGEFAFVLLSRASNMHLVEDKLYLLLLGTTALSLVTTPLLFKFIPVIVHLGILMGWFSSVDATSTEVIIKGENHHSGGSQQLIVTVQGSQR